MSIHHAWRKSSFCDSNLCVEVGAEWTRSSRCANGECLEVRADWQKSSHSELTNCVEAHRPNEIEVHVRDSADPTGPVLRFDAAEWRRFVAGLPERCAA